MSQDAISSMSQMSQMMIKQLWQLSNVVHLTLGVSNDSKLQHCMAPLRRTHLEGTCRRLGQCGLHRRFLEIHQDRQTPNSGTSEAGSEKYDEHIEYRKIYIIHTYDQKTQVKVTSEANRWARFQRQGLLAGVAIHNTRFVRIACWIQKSSNGAPDRAQNAFATRCAPEINSLGKMRAENKSNISNRHPAHNAHLDQTRITLSMIVKWSFRLLNLLIPKNVLLAQAQLIRGKIWTTLRSVWVAEYFLNFSTKHTEQPEAPPPQ